MSLTPTPLTRAMIRAAFAGRVCCVCGAPAERFRGGQKGRPDRFYCVAHLRSGSQHYVGRVAGTKVYRDPRRTFRRGGPS